MQVPIKELDKTLLNILAQDDIHLKCIFTIDEIKNMHYDDIITFIVSLYNIGCILVNKVDVDILSYKNKYEIIWDKPYFFDTFIHIIKNYPIIIEDLMAFYILKYKTKVFHYAFEDIKKI